MDIAQIMKQAKDMQKLIAKQQEEMAGREFEAASGGGMVTARVNGAGQLIAVRMDPQVVDPKDVEMLQDLVVAAVNEAMRQVAEAGQGGMADMMGQMGIKLPGL